MSCPSRLRIRLWDKFKDTRLSCRPSGKCLRALQEQSTSRWFLLQEHTEGHSARACEQNSNTQSSSQSAALEPLFGRTSLFKGNTRRQRRQGSSYTVSVNPTEPCKRKETSAVRSDNEHQTRLYMNVDIAGALLFLFQLLNISPCSSQYSHTFMTKNMRILH